MFKLFEVAVSRYTFAGDELKVHLVQVALKAVTHEELAALFSTYQLRYVHSALHQNKAVAIGSANVHPVSHGVDGAARIFFGMVVYSHDGAPPTEASISYLVKAFELELRESTNAKQAPSASQQGVLTQNLRALPGRSAQISQGAL
ncbi:hypothetical protein ACEN2T_17230 [Pseudomonas sp. W22_MBD1_FP4]|uniref:hypothetical protein n=1 Tax=Pseudomonas sp. W22_MBD1_FP4 TaxID=3240272 RepID=UPI003F9CEC1A